MAEPQSVENYTSIPGVVGVGGGLKLTGGVITERRCITFLVEKKLPARKLPEVERIPKSFDNLPTDVIEVGQFTADCGTSGAGVTQKPFMAGDEIGPVDCAQAGSAGLLLRLPMEGRYGIVGYGDYLLTNYHVVFPISRAFTSAFGRHIRQSVGEGWRRIGTVMRDVRPLGGAAVNQADAALVELQACDTTEQVYEGQEWDAFIDEILQGGGRVNPLFPHYHEEYNARHRDTASPWGFRPPPLGISTPVLGTKAWKSGRTTGVTNLVCIVTGLTTTVNYPAPNGVCKFAGQCIFTTIDGTPPSSGGDSGSVVVDEYNMATALLFSRSGPYAVGTPLPTVLDSLLHESERERLNYPMRALPTRDW